MVCSCLCCPCYLSYSDLSCCSCRSRAVPDRDSQTAGLLDEAHCAQKVGPPPGGFPAAPGSYLGGSGFLAAAPGDFQESVRAARAGRSAFQMADCCFPVSRSGDSPDGFLEDLLDDRVRYSSRSDELYLLLHAPMAEPELLVQP